MSTELCTVCNLPEDMHKLANHQYVQKTGPHGQPSLENGTPLPLDECQICKASESLHVPTGHKFEAKQPNQGLPIKKRSHKKKPTIQELGDPAFTPPAPEPVLPKDDHDTVMYDLRTAVQKLAEHHELSAVTILDRLVRNLPLATLREMADEAIFQVKEKYPDHIAEVGVYVSIPVFARRRLQEIAMIDENSPGEVIWGFCGQFFELDNEFAETLRDALEEDKRVKKP